jgi:hypothetical protein
LSLELTHNAIRDRISEDRPSALFVFGGDLALWQTQIEFSLARSNDALNLGQPKDEAVEVRVLERVASTEGNSTEPQFVRCPLSVRNILIRRLV